MKTIYKFTLDLVDSQTIQMPEGASVLSLQLQYGQPCLWALVDTDKPLTPRRFITRGTGHPVPSEWVSYAGTYQLQGGDLVFHVLEVT